MFKRLLLLLCPCSKLNQGIYLLNEVFDLHEFSFIKDKGEFMKRILVVFITTCGLLLSGVAYSDQKFDLTFETNSGKVVVIDSFGTIRKSNISIDDVAKMQNEMRRLQQKIEELERKINQLERKR